MSLIEQIQTHQLYNTIDNYIESLVVAEEDTEFLTNLNEYGIQTLNRCKAVFNQLKYRLDSIDPYLQRKPVLDAILTECSNIFSMLQSYRSYLIHDSHLNTINNRLDNILANMIAIPQLIDADAVEGVRNTVISFRRTVGQHRTRIQKLQELYTAKTEEVSREAEEIKNSFNSIIEQHKSKFDEFESSVTTLQQSLIENDNQRKLEFEQKLVTFSERFDEKISELSEQWQQKIEENENFFRQTVEDIEQQQQTLIQETKQKQEQYDNILDAHKKSVESLVGIISTNSISGHFKEVADKKEKSASNWQKITILGFLLTISFGVYAFIISPHLDWPSLIAKFIVTTGLGSFTAYAARQATKNEIQERYNRKMEVELKTLNPYIASFSEEDQIKLKEQLFPLIFGRAEVEPKLNNIASSQVSNPVDTKDVTNIATNAIEVLKNLTSNKGA
jgi:hypothetical protein